MNKTTFIYVALMLVIMTSCNESYRHPNGVNAVFDDTTNLTYRIGYNTNEDGTLNKAFVLHPSLEYTSKQEAKGVFWVKHATDGLWVNGKKIQYPKSFKVIAIKANGDISPINCSKKELKLFRPGAEIYSEKEFIKSKILPPFE